MKNITGKVNWVSDHEIATKKIEQMKNEEKELKIVDGKKVDRKIKEIIALNDKLTSKLEELYEMSPERRFYDSIIASNMLSKSMDE